jgi:hypothetical protein
LIGGDRRIDRNRTPIIAAKQPGNGFGLRFGEQIASGGIEAASNRGSYFRGGFQILGGPFDRSRVEAHDTALNPTEQAGDCL